MRTAESNPVLTTTDAWAGSVNRSLRSRVRRPSVSG